MSDNIELIHKMTGNYFRLHKLKQFTWTLLRGVLVVGICFLIIYPLFIKGTTSFMEERDMYDLTVTNIPKHVTLSNYLLALDLMDFGKSFMNSFILSLMVSVLQLVSCTLVGYGFARFKFPGKNLFFGLVILVLVVPPQTLSIPLFMSFRHFNPLGIGKHGINLLDSMWPYAMMAITSMGLKNGLYIYIIRQYFRGMPKELEESGLVDGAGYFRIFSTIMVPGAIPILSTTFLFSFVWQWTDIFYAGVLLKSFKVLPKALSGLSVAVSAWLGQQSGQDFVISPAFSSQINNAGTILVILPLLLLYMIVQRSFVESINRAGIVG